MAEAYANEVVGPAVITRDAETHGKIGLMTKLKQKVRKVRNVLTKPLYTQEGLLGHGNEPETNPNHQVEEFEEDEEDDNEIVPVGGKGDVTSVAHGFAEKGGHGCQFHVSFFSLFNLTAVMSVVRNFTSEQDPTGQKVPYYTPCRTI